MRNEKIGNYVQSAKKRDSIIHMLTGAGILIILILIVVLFKSIVNLHSLEDWYHIFSIIGVFATLSAVAVAIWIPIKISKNQNEIIAEQVKISEHQNKISLFDKKFEQYENLLHIDAILAQLTLNKGDLSYMSIYNEIHAGCVLNGFQNVCVYLNKISKNTKKTSILFIHNDNDKYSTMICSFVEVALNAYNEYIKNPQNTLLLNDHDKDNMRLVLNEFNSFDTYISEISELIKL